MDKTYQAAKYEGAIYQRWMDEDAFTPKSTKKQKTFVITLPPPNVTGNLHMGHALTVTIEDAIVRFKRMQGFTTLWLPGFDHAGIATQVVVERELKKRGISRQKLGRDAFTKEVWKWVTLYRGNIESQLKTMGASLNWECTRFTLDEKYQEAVKEAFFHLYRNGLIYRGERMINWCARCQTVLSDLEVDYREEPTKLYYIKYGPLVVATVRPEPIPGDTAVAVNPTDTRYKKFVGKRVSLPVGNRMVPVIVDKAVDPHFGTGVIKVTPAHDPVDFEIAKRHNLEIRQVIGFDNKMNENAGIYAGLDLQEAKQKILEELEREGLVEKVQDYTHRKGFCSRCNTAVEPQVSLQWFVKTKPLAKPIIEAAKKRDITFVPSRFKNVFFQWMENIHDWCISRQLWWGHQLPVYYCKQVTGVTSLFAQKGSAAKAELFKVQSYCDEIIVAKEKPKKCPKCGNTNIVQDEGVLDTWFSSGLWPFATLGWPKKTKDFRQFYPTDVLETGYDILFFWVARMLMMGKKLTGKLPFHTVYLHGLVRDKRGRKMSKSLGNVVDPLEVSKEYGVDALRFALLYGNSPGNDTRFDPSHLVGGRNFANKLWNISRFAKLKIKSEKLKIIRENLKFMQNDDVDKEFLRKLQLLKKSVTRHLNNYRLAQALQEIHTFTWHEFADRYLEHVKEVNNKEKLLTFNFALLTLLKLLHPFMPFVTEVIWDELGFAKRTGLLINSPWK